MLHLSLSVGLFLSFCSLFFWKIPLLQKMTSAQAWKLKTPHDSSIRCMHSHRLPLIHLKNFVVFLYIYIYWIPSEFWKPLVPYFIQDQIICMHCCSFKDHFVHFVLTWEHFELFLSVWIFSCTFVTEEESSAQIRLVRVHLHLLMAWQLTLAHFYVSALFFRRLCCRPFCSYDYIPLSLLLDTDPR